MSIITTQADAIVRGYEKTAAPSATRTIVITSGKGGVGKTQLAVNLAAALSLNDRRVLLVDTNLGLGDAAMALGVNPEYSIHHILTGERTIEDVICTGPVGIQLVAASRSSDDFKSLPPWQRERLSRELLSPAACACDFVIIDTSADVVPAALGLDLQSPEVIVVTTPYPASITDAYATMKAIAAEGSIPVRVVVNMATDASEAGRAYRVLAEIGKRHLRNAPEYLGWIPTDPAVGRGCMARFPFLLKLHGSPASAAVRAIAAQI